MDKKQIIDFLKVFQDYCHWMYFDREGVKAMAGRLVQHNGVKMYVNLRHDGNYMLKFPELKIELNVAPRIVASPPVEGTLENMIFEYEILNPEIIPAEFDETIREMAQGYCGSAFSRASMFCSFARLAPVSVDEIASDLETILLSSKII